MVRESFAAMGTTIELLLDVPDGRPARRAMATGRAEFARLEALLSRFRPGSELSALNRARRLRVGPDLLRVVSAALALRRRTGGRFDPTVGRAVTASGYDRTFGELRDDPRPPAAAQPAGGTVALDAEGGWIALGDGVDLDLGAIAKGDAADRACALMAGAGPCLVSAGGDIAVSGPRPEGPWTVAIATADLPLTLALERGGLATSGTDRRRWTRGGRAAHHAIDPRRGRAATTDLVRATAVAATAAEADALATALLVAGSGEAGRLADRWRVPAALVGEDGGLVLAGGLS